MKYNILIIALLVLSVACRKTIPIDEKYQAPQTVLNGVFSLTDDTISVYVTESQAIFGYNLDYKMVNDAELSLYENDTKLGVFVLGSEELKAYDYEPGYGARYDFPVGHIDPAATYRVVLNHPTMDNVNAEAAFSNGVEIDSLRLGVEEVLQYGELETKGITYVSFTDNAGEENYYQIADAKVTYGSIFYRDSLGADDFYYPIKTDSILLVEYDITFYSWDQIDPLIAPNEDDLMSYTENNFMIFNDEVINGKSYTLRLVMNSYNTFSESLDTASGEFYQMEISLNALPKDLYLYYKSVDAFYMNDGNFFAEPVQIYSNVENGLGIFSTYRQSTKVQSMGRAHRDDVTYITYDDLYQNDITKY